MIVESLIERRFSVLACVGRLCGHRFDLGVRMGSDPHAGLRNWTREYPWRGPLLDVGNLGARNLRKIGSFSLGVRVGGSK